MGRQERQGGGFEFKPRVKGRWNVKQENVELIKDALCGVVNEPQGTGKRARLDQIKVAGKTGTAQVIALPEEQESVQEQDIPYKFRDHSWFVAVAPAEDPAVAITILVEHGGHGGSVAAPIAKDILTGYFKGIQGL